jgi:hypothetical protein
MKIGFLPPRDGALNLIQNRFGAGKTTNGPDRRMHNLAANCCDGRDSRETCQLDITESVVSEMRLIDFFPFPFKI